MESQESVQSQDSDFYLISETDIADAELEVRLPQVPMLAGPSHKV